MMTLSFGGIEPRLGNRVFVAQNAVLIGDLEVADESSVWFGCVLRADVNTIRIGARTNIQDLSVVHVQGGGFPTILGDDVTVGHGAIVHGCHVGDRVLVGMQACVMDGAVIGNESLVAAGALVTPGTQVPAGVVVAGRPARVTR